MEFQGERELGVLQMDVGLVESMVQDGDPEQDIGVQEQEPPNQTQSPKWARQRPLSMTPPPSPPPSNPLPSPQ